jgi:hypothetical protein
MPAWHESLATLIIGTLATGLGMAALSDIVVGVPLFDLVFAAHVGQWLGIGGIFWAFRSGRGMSPLSLLGTVLCLVAGLPGYLLVDLLLLGIASGLVFAAWVVRGVMRMLRELSCR